MSNNIYTVWTGLVPEGSEVTEWDWAEDYLGFRFKVEYTLIPAEVVTEVETYQGTLSDGAIWADVLEAVTREVEAVSWEFNAPAGMERVYQVTAQGGNSFVATAWNTLDKTLDSLT